MSLVILTGCGDLEQTVGSLAVSPTSKTIGVGKTQLFRAVAHDTLGIIITSPSVTWTVSNGLGSISSTGIFTAGATAGSCEVTASSEGIQATAVVTITETAWLSGYVRDNYSRYVGTINVILSGTTFEALSESNGWYEISDLPPGSYEVTTLATGLYSAATPESITVTSGETKSHNIRVNSLLNQEYNDPLDGINL